MKTTFLLFAVLALLNFKGLRAFEVCCTDLGCFNDSSPYNGQPLPKCPQYLALDIKLYTRQNQMEGEEFSRTVFPPSFNASLGLMFIVHGWTQNGLYDWMHDIKNATLQTADYNVVIVGWSGGSRNINYFQSASDTRTAGAEIALLAQKAIANGLPRTNLYCVGHSLGAHVCGHAGNRFKFGRVTGLDAASPAFEDRGIGLNSASADFVDVIHTFTKLNLGLLRIGTLKALGHVDFYPNGGQTQPGCDGSGDPISIQGVLGSMDPGYAIGQILSFAGPICDHGRSIYLYLESILTPCFVARSSCSDVNILPGSCKIEGKVQYMGLSSILYPSRGIFYLTTYGRTPFCKE